MKRLQLSCRDNNGYVEGDKNTPRMYASLTLSRYGIEEEIDALPIYFNKSDRPAGSVLETYSTCVAGLSLEKGDLDSLERTLDLYIGALIHFGRLPEYLFTVGGKAWPIYRLPDQLVTRYPGSPVLGAATIGELRVALADYFKIAGLIRNRKDLQILMLSRHDLQLYAPVFTFRAEAIADIPVFPVEKAGGVALSAPVNTIAIDVPCNDGQGILDLHSAVSEHLILKGKLDQATDLTIRKLSARSWRSLVAVVRPYDSALTYYDDEDGQPVQRIVPVFANGNHLVAGKTNHLTRTTLYVGTDIWRLQDQIGQELYSVGKLSSPDYVTVTSAERRIATVSE